MCCCRLVGVANEFVDVVEASVAVFLIVEIDDYLYEILRGMHAVDERIESLQISDNNNVVLAEASQHPTEDRRITCATLRATLYNATELFASDLAQITTFFAHVAEFAGCACVAFSGAVACSELGELGCEGVNRFAPDAARATFYAIWVLFACHVVAADFHLIRNRPENAPWPALAYTWVLSTLGWVTLVLMVWLVQPGKSLDIYNNASNLWWAALMLVAFILAVMVVPANVATNQCCKGLHPGETARRHP